MKFVFKGFWRWFTGKLFLEHMEDTNTRFLEELLPWSETLTENIIKPKQYFLTQPLCGLCYCQYVL